MYFFTRFGRHFNAVTSLTSGDIPVFIVEKNTEKKSVTVSRVSLCMYCGAYYICEDGRILLYDVYTGFLKSRKARLGIARPSITVLYILNNM